MQSFHDLKRGRFFLTAKAGRILRDARPAVKRAGPEMAGLHFVEKKQKSALIAKFSETNKILRRRGRDSALALDRLDENGRGLRRDRGAHRVEIVEGHLPKPRHHRLETLLHFLLTGRGDSRQRPSVERPVSRENFEPAGVVPKFSRKLVETFVRFRAAVTKETTARSDQPD